MKSIRFFLPALLGIVFFVGCSKDSMINTSETSEFAPAAVDRDACTVTPVRYDNAPDYPGGNVECWQVGSYESSTGRIDDETKCGSTVGPISWTTDPTCTYVSWTWNGPGTPCGMSIIVHGGNAANVYTYPDGCTSGTGLSGPLNNGGQVPELSNITFCYNTCYEVVCNDETGWGGLSAGGGNAWWFYFDTQGPATQTIYAGQTLEAGEVTWDGSNFTIVLYDGWSLNPNTTEPVKAQGYNTLPTKRPAAGLFTLYKGTSLTFPGNGTRYYAIHLDLQYCE